MYGCERWTIKKAERTRIDAFELLGKYVGEDSWESLELQGDPTQSILKEISPGCSLEVLMLKLKLQYFGHLMRRVDSLERPWCWEVSGAGGEGNDTAWDGWMVSPTRWTWVWVNTGSWWWTRRPGLLWFMGSQRVRHDWATELNWKSQVVLVIKNPPTNSGDLRDEGLIPGSGRSPGGGHGYPLQYACLEDPMDGGAWRAAVPGVAKTQTWLKWLSIHVKEPGGLKEISMIFFHLGFKK